MPTFILGETREKMPEVRIKKSAPHYKGKKALYNGETIYPNGRHSVSLFISTGASMDKWGGYPIEMNESDVDFSLMDETLRNIDDMRGQE